MRTTGSPTTTATRNRRNGRTRRCSSAAAAGARFDALELNAYPSGGPVVVTNDARGAAAERADAIRRQSGVELTVDEVLVSPHVFIGSVDGLAEKCRELRERFGITSIMLDDYDAAAAVIERLS